MSRRVRASLILTTLWLSVAATVPAREVAVRRRSPRAVARLPLAAANVAIDYGQVALAGRPGFGGLAPWGEVWRFGDDEATRLETDVPLRLGSLRIEPGAYALFLVPQQSGADAIAPGDLSEPAGAPAARVDESNATFELLIHSRADRWGAYQRDPALDVGRVRLRAARLERPLERLSIVWESTGEDRGRLWIGWEDRVLWTDFEAAERPVSLAPPALLRPSGVDG